jgi:ATP-dependent Clp protease ATP-binding subunit ClpC
MTEGPADLLRLAQAEAAALREEDYVGTEHLLLAMIGLDDGPAARVLACFDVSRDRLMGALRQITRRRPGCSPPGELALTLRARRALEKAGEFARELGEDRVGPEHVLLALLGDDETIALTALRSLGVVPRALGMGLIREAGWPEPDAFQP